MKWFNAKWGIYLSGALVLLFFLTALLAGWIAGEAADKNSLFPLIKFGPESIDVFNTTFLGPPDSQHLFGTDDVGHDILSRLVHAIQRAILFSIVVVAASAAIGLAIGSIIGFFGGKIDLIFSRLMEVIGNFPIFLLQLTILAMMPPNYTVLFAVMVFAGWIPYTRFTRAEFFRLRNLDYVQAAQALGASRRRIIFKHLLPNSLTPTLVYLPFDLSSTIVGLGALSFLGFGEPINVPSLGGLLKQAQEHFHHAWWLAVFPGGALFLMTLSFTLFGSAIRDWLDPRKSA